jgi:hypothetical protein
MTTTNRITASLVALLLYITPCFAQNNFDKWFENKALRIDYFLAGNSKMQSLYLDEFRIEPYWSGSFTNTVDKLNFGTHRVEVTDKESGLLIFSQGFCTLFQEWQTINEAKFLNRAFEQVTRIPFPKNKVVVTFKLRESDGSFSTLSQLDIDPQSIFIENKVVDKHNVTKIANNGDSNSKLDIVFIAEGYTELQMEKFRDDVKSMSDYLFSIEPFVNHKSDINIWAIESASNDEGPTNPGKGIWNVTATQSSFYTFGIDRYLTTTKYKRVMDIAANAPGDIVYILVNSPEYGGGGIYNHYNVTTSGHPLSKIVFAHELGHGLAGLGDEYYSSDVAYENFYPLNIEPWEPNLTTLVNFDSKWVDLVAKDTPIPTPVNELTKKSIGAFEGGGYVSKGVYRSHFDCRMKSNSAPGFCPVCQIALTKVIKGYTKDPL